MGEDLVEQFREQRRRRGIVYATRMGTRFITLPVFLSFWICDLIYAPEKKWTFLAIRLSCIPLFFLVNLAMARWNKNRVQLELVLSAFLFGNGAIILPMIYLTEGVSSPYYAGLNVIGVAALALPPWSSLFLVINILSIYGPYWIFGIFAISGGAPIRPFLVHNFFIVGTIGVTLTIRAIMERLREKELISRVQLHQELESRSRIIEVKTEEAVKLRNLATQFSPQIVHAIQQGKVNILDSTHQAEICTVFIDIVDSTNRVRTLKADSTQQVIGMFMRDVMRTLLKYDITIDKFLGDGVLGFSNDPLPREDFIARVVDASLEVRSVIEARGLEYANYWQVPLEVRCGIAVGTANVGFYGSEEYFRSYTAIGEVVNLASRLCSVARPGQILVEEQVVKRLPTRQSGFNPQGEVALKGFADKKVLIYEVSQSARAALANTDITLCPQGHGVLHLDSDASGIYFLMCRTCGYQVSESPDKPVKNAA